MSPCCIRDACSRSTGRTRCVTLSGSLFEVIVADHRRAPDVLTGIDGVNDVQMFGERAHVRMDRAGADAIQLLSSRLTAAGLEAVSVRPIATSLEAVFIAKLHEETHETHVG